MKIITGGKYPSDRWVVVAEWLGSERIVFDPELKLTGWNKGAESFRACLNYIKENS